MRGGETKRTKKSAKDEKLIFILHPSSRSILSACAITGNLSSVSARGKRSILRPTKEIHGKIWKGKGPGAFPGPGADVPSSFFRFCEGGGRVGFVDGYIAGTVLGVVPMHVTM